MQSATAPATATPACTTAPQERGANLLRRVPRPCALFEPSSHALTEPIALEAWADFQALETERAWREALRDLSGSSRSRSYDYPVAFGIKKGTINWRRPPLHGPRDNDSSHSCRYDR